MFKQASPPKPIVRTFAVAFAAAAAIATPILIYGTGFGLSPREFAAEGDATLRAAPYAFSIWALIYLGIAAYAVYQALPATANGRWLDKLAWPSVIALIGCALWLFAAALNAKWATAAIIVVSAAAVTTALWRGGDVGQASFRQALFILSPLGLLAGWLTIASALNWLTVLTWEGTINAETAPVWAAAGIALTVLVGVLVTHRTRLLAYPLPIVWGLAAVYVAEQADKPMLAIMTATGAAILAVYALFRALRGAGGIAVHS